MGSAQRGPTADELARMKDLLRESLREGARGFSTGLSYAPGTFATTEELVELLPGARCDERNDRRIALDHPREDDLVGCSAGVLGNLGEHPHTLACVGARALLRDGAVSSGSRPAAASIVNSYLSVSNAVSCASRGRPSEVTPQP